MFRSIAAGAVLALSLGTAIPARADSRVYPAATSPPIGGPKASGGLTTITREADNGPPLICDRASATTCAVEMIANVVLTPTPLMLSNPTLVATRGSDIRGATIVTVAWSMSYENNTLGYKVLRSLTASLSGAGVVSDGLIAALGGGGNYKWVDISAPHVAAWYWIEEIELDGVKVNTFGPAVALVATVFRAYLPLNAR
ncbi:MAG: hypothetical protein ABIQ99_18290 [Thermoflexales bacterium]